MAEPPTSCLKDVALCGSHGSCVNGACSCQYFWSGVSCGTAFDNEGWAAWDAFLAVVAIIHVLVILGCILNVHGLWVSWFRCGDPKSAPSSRCCGVTLRDAACILNMFASIIRLIWLADPLGTQSVYVDGTAALLLRLPQLIWVAAFSLIILSWSYVMSVISDAAVSSYTVLRIVVTVLMVCAPFLAFVPLAVMPPLWCCQIVLIGITVPAAVLHAADGAEMAHDVSTGAFTVYAIVVVIAAIFTCLKLRRMLRHEMESLSIPRTTLSRLEDTVTMTVRSTVAVTCLVIILFVSTIVVTALRIRPHDHPHDYMAYMFFVHGVAEGGSGFNILYATNVGTPTVSWLLLWPGNWRRSHSVDKHKTDMHDRLLSAALHGSHEPGNAERQASVGVPVHQAGGVLLRMDTENDFAIHRLSICSEDSHDSYRVAESPVAHFYERHGDYAAYGIQLTPSRDAYSYSD